MRSPVTLCWPTCSLCCIAYCLHWLPQRPSAATNSEGSHSVRLFIYVQKIYIYVPKNIPEQFTAIGPPSFIRGEGVGSQKRWHYSRGIGLFLSGDSAGDFGLSFVRRFRRRFRPEEFSSARDSLWRPTQLYLEGRGWEGRGWSRGGQQSINYCSIIALRCLWKLFLI